MNKIDSEQSIGVVRISGWEAIARERRRLDEDAERRIDEQFQEHREHAGKMWREMFGQATNVEETTICDLALEREHRLRGDPRRRRREIVEEISAERRQLPVSEDHADRRHDEDGGQMPISEEMTIWDMARERDRPSLSDRRLREAPRRTITEILEEINAGEGQLAVLEDDEEAEDPMISPMDNDCDYIPKSAPNDNIASEKSWECAFCLSNRKVLMPLPCMHFVYCVSCARATHSKRQCFVCRASIDRFCCPYT